MIFIKLVSTRNKLKGGVQYINLSHVEDISVDGGTILFHMQSGRPGAHDISSDEDAFSLIERIINHNQDGSAYVVIDASKV